MKKEIVINIMKKIEKQPYDENLYYDCFEGIKLLARTDKEEAYELNKEFRRYLQKAERLSFDVSFAGKLVEIRKLSYLLEAQDVFDSYLTYVEWNRQPQKRFYRPRRKVLKPVVDAMQDLMDDKLDLLAISLPPGVGKTTLAIFFLTWIMGKYPDSPNLASGHSSYLTRSFYDGVLTILTDKEEYLWSDVFPEITHVESLAKETSIHLGQPNRFKTLTTRSIEGSLTGVTRCEKLLY